MSDDKGAKGPNLRDWMTVGEAADFLGVSAATLRNWDRAGKVKAARHPVNRYRLYRRGDLERLLRQLRGEAD
jgi:excisionase family DNA binding protein